MTESLPLLFWIVAFLLIEFQFYFWFRFADSVRGKPLEIASPCKAVAVPALQDEAYPKLRIAWVAFSMNRNNLFSIFNYSLYFLFIFLLIYEGVAASRGGLFFPI